MWSGVGQYPQARELACRENEEDGVGPPEVPTHIFEILPEEAQQKITEAIVRALVIAEKVKPAAILAALVSIGKEASAPQSDRETSIRSHPHQANFEAPVGRSRVRLLQGLAGPEQESDGKTAETWRPGGQVALVATSHIEANHPKAIDCDTCDRTRLKEAPAKKGKKDEEKIIVNNFGDLVHMDTLFF